MSDEAVLDVSLMEKIIDSMLDFQGITKTLKYYGVNKKAFFKMLAKNPALGNQYMHAQQAIAELLAEEIIDISDTDNDAARARNRIDTRKWYAGKTSPQKFGDRIDLNINQVVDIGSALLEARKRVDSLKAADTQAIDITPQLKQIDTGYEPVDAPETKDATKKSSDDIFE